MLAGCVPWPEEDVRRYKQAGYWKDLTLGEHLDSWVQQHLNRPALAYGGREISYLEMDEHATRLAYRMARMGMKTYDRVVMQLFNVPELVYFVYACAKIGAIPICTLPTHRWSEIEFLAREAEARAHLVPGGGAKDFDFREFSEEVRKAVPSMELVFTLGKTSRPGVVSIEEVLSDEIDLERARIDLRRFRPDPMEPALFQLSGGTTGTPKLIPRTHNDYCYNAECSARALQLNEQSRVLPMLPLMHNFPLVNVLFAVHSQGGTVALCDLFDPEAILKAVAKNRATAIATVPAVMHRLLDVPEDVRARYALASLKNVYWGGNPLEREIQLQFREAYRCDTDQTYGMAEGLVCWTRPSDCLETKLDTQGLPVSEADEVKVVDINTGREVSVGEVGECWTRGPYTLRGYYRSPERNREAITPEGFYKTGDLIRKDEQGYVIYVGRLKDCISRGGEKINAEEVESHIVHFLKVKNAAVVAMPDKIMGERVCVFIVPQPGQTPNLAELNHFLLTHRRIAKFKLPERMELIDSLPVTKVGKFEKKSLRERIAGIMRAEGTPE